MLADVVACADKGVVLRELAAFGYSEAGHAQGKVVVTLGVPGDAG